MTEHTAMDAGTMAADPIFEGPDLNGKVALVTGGTRGLGLALARSLIEAGARVALIGRDAGTGAHAVAALGENAIALAADVADEQAVKRACADAAAAFGQIDMLVCTAGVGAPRQPVWEAETDAYRQCFDVNVLGVLNAMAAAMPSMIARRAGQVVVIGGTYGHKGVADFAVYAASKWALRGLVRSAALDAAPHGVRVNMVSPGGVDGERLRRNFAESARSRGEPADAPLKRFTASTALGRLVSETDIAAAMLHLLGPGGRMMTGQDIIVDAGTII
ncbi:MAG TPA: SDR family oxidoreductase [Sphingomonas sp.]